jgi:alkanesulfonate monooxygenase SsuD/methylene tetrahydromethanopterin reductase-like flavin-dependent oxidoreductase (luciferase family)
MTDPSVTGVRSGLNFPLFDELADPKVVSGVAVEAEAAGWDGVFVWDHVRWHEPIVDVADPQITLAAVAMATERISFGPMVTPLARRRPVKVARETVTLDILSGRRLRLGVGLGSDRFGAEYSMTGEEVDDRARARMLDEALDIVQAAWSANPSITTASTTRSMECASCRAPSSAPASRSGSQGSPAAGGPCVAPRATTATSRRISTTPTSSSR